MNKSVNAESELCCAINNKGIDFPWSGYTIMAIILMISGVHWKAGHVYSRVML
jgi:hypothetical protein